MYRGNLFQVDANDVEMLRAQWQNLVAQYNTPDEIGASLFNKLVEHYSEKGRAYHNLSHIKTLLDLSAVYKDAAQNNHAIFFAIWFHDAIYNTRENDNEERSAELAAQSLTELGVSENTTLPVQDMILATKHHQANDFSDDSKLFLDLDLSILGTEPTIYKEYSRAIRIEYSWVPKFLYKRGRKKILSSFLERPRIYYLDQMAGIFEAQARQNIESELTELAK
jgi:predicted metal-dependent HD superfamily phosphohydrolase